MKRKWLHSPGCGQKSRGFKEEEIRIPLEDGSSVRLMGKVDRVDIFDDQNDKYISIIDYKSGRTAFDRNQIFAGIQIQLPVYMEASRRYFNAKPAGYFYFHLMPDLQSLTARKKEADETERGKESLEMNRLDGAFLNDLSVMEHLDKGLSGEQMRGAIVKGRITKSGTFDAASNAISQEQFDQIESFVNRKIKHLSSDMKAGKIERSPLDTGTLSACSYCEFFHACPYDRKMPGSHLRTMEKLEKDEFFERISEEEEG